MIRPGDISMYLISSTDEPATDQILKGLQTFASVCGELELNSNRDAFISCICKFSLPSNYVASNLNNLLSKQSQTYEMTAAPGGGSHESMISGNSIVVSGYFMEKLSVEKYSVGINLFFLEKLFVTLSFHLNLMKTKLPLLDVSVVQQPIDDAIHCIIVFMVTFCLNLFK